VLTLPDIGWDAGWDTSWAELDESVSAACIPVRVVGVDRGAVDLLGADGAARATLGGDVLDAMARDPSAAACAGDWGALRVWPDGRTTLEAVLPRRT
jgi:ribosome biogenesis GTPase